jgi:hypothetical protein
LFPAAEENKGGASMERGCQVPGRFRMGDPGGTMRYGLGGSAVWVPSAALAGCVGNTVCECKNTIQLAAAERRALV